MKKRLAAIRKYNNIQKVLNGIIKDNEKEIIAMNRDQMWEDGIVDIVNNLQWDYAESTKKKKAKSKFKRVDHITLRDSGFFYDKMFLKIEPEQFIISSKDKKWDHFSSGDWGEGRFQNALGLTEENKGELRELIRSDLIIGFKDAIQTA